MSRYKLILGLLGLLASGCGQELETRYGGRTGMAAESVNGTSVLADMFKQAGHWVSGASWAGPHLADTADVIVWFPDSEAVPEVKQRRWFEAWLCGEPGRTLVFVGRDYDAAITYWKTALKLAGSQQQESLRGELTLAELRFAATRMNIPEQENCGWFTARGELKHRDVRKLSGSRQWLAGVDPKQVEIELNGRLVPGTGSRPLLVSKPDTLVWEKRFCSSKLLVVTNGSFLLNLPLVNHEHRKLAGKLIESVGSQRRVVFLESGHDGLKVYDKEPESVGRSGLAILVTEPFDIPILHLAVAGIVFCLARFPIFGRPRQWQTDELADFGAHIVALGKLLAATKDRAFALATLASYQRTAHVGAARSNRGARLPTEPIAAAPSATDSTAALKSAPEDQPIP